MTEDEAAGFAREQDTLRLHGALVTRQVPRIWDGALKAARGARRIDLSAVSTLDTTGAALVLNAAGLAGDAPVEGASDPVGAVMQRVRDARAAPRPRPGPPPLPLVGRVGQWGVEGVRSLRAGTAFLGEAATMAAAVLGHPRRMRFGDLLRHIDESGLRAFPLTILLGTLIGVILAFQSSIPMRMFGAEIYIPPLVGISLIRELGPLIAAVILSGRTGSAYAAELGTMTVNEEVDALRIMGVEPVAMLVLPRLLAAMLVMPVLALLMNVSGLIGMTAVMYTLGFPVALVVSQLVQWLTLGSLFGGLAKAAVFGLVIAAIGCRAGLLAGRGPRAVGDAATAAVVGGIVSTVVLDGLFAVLFFRLSY
ncbi:ABC transporter permease [Pseudoroseomonas globiformis]|uniref:ABC transporter permease n=1 Tax=Teichococcus globiformis TaxID=2307229 RepID=A0ABV7G4V4_9PROT